MKVTTDLKSGNWIEDGSQLVGQLGAQVSGFFNAAQQQAEGLTQYASGLASELFQSIKRGLSLK